MDYAYSTAEVKATCLMCHEDTSAIAAESDFERWFCEDEPIERAMPEATPEVREVFLGWQMNSWVCPRCWPWDLAAPSAI
jgi:hypothetical protein